MGTCVECLEEFPDKILSPIIIIGKGDTGPVCGVCALKIRNETHGLHPDTPFQGEVASWMYDEAKKIKDRRR